MKIKITFKDPDALSDAIEEALDERDYGNLTDSEVVAVRLAAKEEAISVCSKWFKYGEYLSVEVDTNAQTIGIVEV